MTTITPAAILAQRAAEMREKILQQRIVNMCRSLGHRVYHTHDSRRSEPGFPDLAIAYPSVTIYAELKREKKRPTRDQVWWLDYFAGLGLPVYLWRPTHLLNGTISMILAGAAAGEGIADGQWVRGEGVLGDKFSLPYVAKGKVK